MKEFLLEIGTEEIPAGFIPQALSSLDALMRKELEANRIDFNYVRTYGTPRRLVLFIESIAERQRDEEQRKIGPPKSAGFDSHGNPTKALIGFARSQSVSPESLIIVETEKGEYLCAIKKEPGRPTAELLASILPKLILSIPFPKSMRWENLSIRFARPIHWIVALFGGEVVPFELGNIRSGNITYGHRFLYPHCIEVHDFDSYLKKTREAFVIVDQEERKKKIEEEMIRQAKSVSGNIITDEELLEEVNFLVEYPVALCGQFDKSFLSLPRDIIIHSMKEHQRYFPLFGEDGRLIPYFIFIANIIPKDKEVVIKGNERVLRARLSDAAYFFNDDLKIPLEKRVDQLRNVVFQAKLGTSYEKVMRFTEVASFICEKIDIKIKETVRRASLLCKADLVTGMVGEFPKLQGVIGREYARISGEKPEVYEAISEHYLPAFAGDSLPSSPVGDILSIADKIDTIVGCFGVGLVPTGTADPFGLRRQALGIIRIIIEKGYSISLNDLIEVAGKELGDKISRPFSEVKEDVKEFFKVRYQNLMLERGYPFDIIEAVISTSFDDLLDARERIDALCIARKWEDFNSIVIGFKRAMNILKGFELEKEINPALFCEEAERNLYNGFLKAKEKIDDYLAHRDYGSALSEMVKLKSVIDDFFDQVMVMVEEKEIRYNRLALLERVGGLFLRIADFSKLS